MKERPILFSAPMVRALLDGSKTQTRRIAKLHSRCRSVSAVKDIPGAFYMRDENGHAFNEVIKSPYGAPDDRLWVRENGWERPDRTPQMMRNGADTWEPYYYDADPLTDQDHADFKAWGFKRRPSIHMPRTASRILLEVTCVRVERLYALSEVDAISEGIKCPPLRPDEPVFNARAAYFYLWQQINGAGSDVLNPWVWVVEFKKIASSLARAGK